ncbi:unknown protein [Nostoc sp. NIES-3756]|uniref:hypothetical protein n=1 Tax=Nostoc sp. NIES-3756 TaxID=1751286 RepID=UPI00071EF7A3|nr:hypothetical protein [Nostoc sp. NIES-3756]BAT53513.1 unknown protein [Nostoc sp. NIES-3756]
MQSNYFISNEEKEKLFHTQLVKYGVKYDKAAKAAQLMVSDGLENLTQQEQQLVTEACQEWLKAKKRCGNINSNCKSSLT